MTEFWWDLQTAFDKWDVEELVLHCSVLLRRSIWCEFSVTRVCSDVEKPGGIREAGYRRWRGCFCRHCACHLHHHLLQVGGTLASLLYIDISLVRTLHARFSVSCAFPPIFLHTLKCWIIVSSDSLRFLFDCRVRMIFEGLWKFGENGIHFSRPWKFGKTEWGLWKFVSFVVFRALGTNYQLISQKLHFPRPNSSLIFFFFIAVQNHRECTSCQFWLIECVGHWLQQGLRPFTGCVEELRTFVLLFHTILQRFVNFERIFLYEPCKWALSTAGIRSLNNTVLLSRQRDKSSEDSITAQFAHSCQCIVQQAATILVTLCILFFLLS